MQKKLILRSVKSKSPLIPYTKMPGTFKSQLELNLSNCISPTMSNFLNNSAFSSKNYVDSLRKTRTLVFGRLCIQTKRYNDLFSVTSRVSTSAFVKYLFEKILRRKVPS